ncbi:MAG: hypothetical protein H6840_06940 [Planctomycetes bacterium]|nr:hypothetical protein [Planctomycetota bacterium]
MGRLAFLLFFIEAALLLALLPAPRADAGEVVARALDASSDSAALRLGDYTWIEECGLGIELPPAPLTGGEYPRLLAGKWIDAGRSAALWELGPEGFSSLQKRLEAEGARFSGGENYPFRPRQHSGEVTAHRSGVQLAGGRSGVLVDWTTGGRSYALLVSDATADQAARRMDELLRELVQLEGVEANALAPLLFGGRYAVVLKGWHREADRLRRRTPQGWFSLRVFQVPLTDFESMGMLQNELETRLKAAGINRSAGLKPTIAGSEGFVGEYFGTDEFVQRIAFARLEGGYMVALMQAPEAQREALSQEMDQLTRSLQLSGIVGARGAPPLYFNRVRNIRCLAWQDGRRVLWGAFFDDSRQQPVLWREDEIGWSIQMTRGGQMVREREGQVNSSRALNPLVDAELRALELPENFKGDVELALNVGGERTTTTLSIK